MQPFAEYVWYPWLFDNCPRSFWSDISNQRKFFDWMGGELGIKNAGDWHRVDVREVRQRGGRGLLVHHNESLSSALATAYPGWKIVLGLGCYFSNC